MSDAHSSGDHPAAFAGNSIKVARNPLSNATRYLCAAAYIDDDFREKVLDELLGDPYRAVPPSLGGFDLSPVLAHCLRARRMLFAREAVITALLFLALLVDPILFAAMGLTLLPAGLLFRFARRTTGIRRVLVLLGGAWILAWLLSGIYALALITFLPSGAPGPYGDASPRTSGSSLSGTMAEVLLWAACLLVALGYWVVRYITLAELKPGTRIVPAADAPLLSDRLAYIDQAQWGNVTLYGAENPFIGAGDVVRSWSITVELDRRAHAPRDRSVIRIDPVDLHRFIRERLGEMRDAAGSPAENLDHMYIGDRLVADGTLVRLDWSKVRSRRPWGPESHPLIDEDGLPRYRESEEGMASIIRNPQSGVRYYQQITIGAEGKAVIGPQGGLIAPGIDTEVVVTAFIHLAVQGRMLYTEFVVTVLPPIRQDYHIVDVLPFLSLGTVFWRAIKAVRPSLLTDVFLAPPRLVEHVRERLRRQPGRHAPDAFLSYPYGARLSVRELGAATALSGYLQVLDRDKHVKLIQQRITASVLDYLEERGVDTSGYREQARTIINNGTMITGGTVTGPVAGGTGAQAVQVAQTGKQGARSK